MGGPCQQGPWALPLAATGRRRSRSGSRRPGRWDRFRRPTQDLPRPFWLMADVGSGTEIEVSVLGPVSVLGAARPLRRAWALDLVVYLALHPRGATTEQWSTALWPDRLMAPSTMYSTASAARRALGRSPSGSDHLPHGHGRLHLAPTVRTDFGQLRELADRPDPEFWGEGLALVRGRPFDGLRSPDWTVLEGISSQVEELVVRTAMALAEHRLVAGDGPGATWAARQGLRASPFDERLFRLLLRAADLEGNPAGVESAMAELMVLVGESSPGHAQRGTRGRIDELPVHPETSALYWALSRRPGSGATRGSFARL